MEEERGVLSFFFREKGLLALLPLLLLLLLFAIFFLPPPFLFWAMPCEKRKRARLSGNDDERGATATNVLARFSSTPKNKEKAGEGELFLGLGTKRNY